MVIVLFGVTGSGKTTIGLLLADYLGWQFVDADDHHSPANVAKMAGGVPLDDDDRREWLEKLRTIIEKAVKDQQNFVLACSALKAAYRAQLGARDEVKFVLLNADPETIRLRLTARTRHFMPPNLIQSQFETLETGDPVDLIVDSSMPADVCLTRISKLLEKK